MHRKADLFDLHVHFLDSTLYLDCVLAVSLFAMVARVYRYFVTRLPWLRPVPASACGPLVKHLIVNDRTRFLPASCKYV